MTATRKSGFFAAIVLMSFMAIPAFGQADPGANGAGGGGQGGGRRFDPAQMRQRMLDRLKEELGANDDEFKALQPKIEKVMTAQRDSRGFGGMMGGGRRRGGDNNATPPATPPAADPSQPVSPVQEKLRDLRTTLEDKEAKPDDIKAKLAALRDARTKAKEDLTKAQADLREVLTQRQEAVLVMAGMLD